MQKTGRNIGLTKAEICWLIFCFAFYFIWAISKPFNYAPDEYMRYAVSEFLYINNRLPVGTETINELWGFSYAHLPTMLCNILSYIPMKFVGYFSQDAFLLVIAARMVSVLSGTGVVYFVIKTAKLLFPSNTKWIMTIFVSMIPQFVFLSSYLNNDIVALLGCSIILYAWVVALNNDWEFKTLFTLAFGIIICALSYYNSYGWILCSIIFFIGTYFIKHPKDYKGLFKNGLIISVVVLAGISYMFVRHFILYGDFLGLSTLDFYGELYASSELKPSNRVTPENQGTTISYMLFDMQWLKLTYLSFIECFGYMTIFATPYVYVFYTAVFLLCLIGSLLNLKEILFLKKYDKRKYYFVFCLVLVAVIPIGLSISRSYTAGFQAQGRYCYPALLAIAVWVTSAIQQFINRYKNSEWNTIFISILCSTITMITISEFFTKYLSW